MLMPVGTNAVYTHESLTLTVTVNGSDTTAHNVRSNPLVIDLDQPLVVSLALTNAGETVHLTDATVSFYTIQTILLWELETKVYDHQVDLDNDDEDGDGKEGFDIPAAASETDSFSISPEEIAEYKDALAGQRVRIDILFNFETIADYTIKVYINFV
jgi:hypothetical protein